MNILKILRNCPAEVDLYSFHKFRKFLGYSMKYIGDVHVFVAITTTA